MKITAIETIRIEDFENLLWVQVHTDEGIVGLGETFYGPKTVESYIHETAANKILGANPLEIDKISRDLVGYLGFRSSGVEVRGNSAIDIALWDIFGKACNQPIAQMLGGFTREKIRTYNTCAGSTYMRKNKGQATVNYGLNSEKRQYDDLNGFLNHADELAEDLLSEGITAMKIWPFDMAAEKSNGLYISNEDLKLALQPFEKIRKRVGDKMDIMVEFHSMWQLLPAMQIARALTPYNTFWHEDPIKMDSLSSLKRYAEASIAPICASETLGSRFAFRDYLETGVAGIVMLDLSWCGGISQFENNNRTAFYKDLQSRPFSRRIYLSDGSALGDQEMFIEPQIFLMQDAKLPVEKKKKLWVEMQNRLLHNEMLGPRQREHSVPSPKFGSGTCENGGLWYALTGPLIVGLTSFDTKAASALLERITFSHFAKCYPDYWVGHWTAPDTLNTFESGELAGLPRPEDGGFWFNFSAYCAHAHAWPLYAYLRIKNLDSAET